jgi:hypothetical protein
MSDEQPQATSLAPEEMYRLLQQISDQLAKVLGGCATGAPGSPGPSAPMYPGYPSAPAPSYPGYPGYQGTDARAWPPTRMPGTPQGGWAPAIQTPMPAAVAQPVEPVRSRRRRRRAAASSGYPGANVSPYPGHSGALASRYPGSPGPSASILDFLLPTVAERWQPSGGSGAWNWRPTEQPFHCAMPNNQHDVPVEEVSIYYQCTGSPLHRFCQNHNFTKNRCPIDDAPLSEVTV